ncbi:MAG: GntR family transcriptional regulator [Desulfosalsimonas sp.]
MKDLENTPIIDLNNINKKIYDYIKENIIWCEFPPGTKINVKKLCGYLGVSYTPVKDALYQLAGEGLVIISPRAGTYVRNITEEDIHEVLKVRLYLEEAAVTEIVPRLTDEQLRILKSIYEESVSIAVDQRDKGSYKRFLECDSDLHRTIIDFAGNKWLNETYSNLNVHMQTFRYLVLRGIQGKLPTTDHDHKMIIDAFFERDVEKVKKAVSNHIRNTDHHWAKIGKLKG